MKEHLNEQESHTASTASPAPEMLQMRDAVRRFRSVPFLLSFELGRGQLKIRELLALRYHSLVQTNRVAGGNLDIRINGVMLGKGEPVISENRVGVKINEILDSES